MTQQEPWQQYLEVLAEEPSQQEPPHAFYLAYPHHQDEAIEILTSAAFWRSTEMFQRGSGHAAEYVQVWVPADYPSEAALYEWLVCENAARRGEEP